MRILQHPKEMHEKITFGMLEPLYRKAFQCSGNKDLDVVYQCLIKTTGQCYHLIVNAEDLRLVAGTHPDPTLTLIFSSMEIPWLMLHNRLDPIAAFMNETVRSDSHLLLTMQYMILFANIPAETDLS